MPQDDRYQQLQETIRLLEAKADAATRLSNLLFEEQQFLQILLDTIPSPIFYKDRHGVYRHCNEAFSRDILGLAREQILNKSLFDLSGEIPRDLALLYQRKDRELFDNPGTQVYKSTVRCSDGETRVYQFYKSTILNEVGEAVGLVGIMLDITHIEERHSRLLRENDTLASISFTDSLTGLFNRRKFDQVFPEMLRNSGNGEGVLHIALFDLDHFKSYNDTHGHPAGDAALVRAAEVIRANLERGTDYVFRIGGEEFCALFRSRDVAHGVQKTEQIRQDMENLTLSCAGNDPRGRVTLSAGLLSLKNPITDHTEVYEKTDRLLYQAKHAGRNRVVHGIL